MPRPVSKLTEAEKIKLCANVKLIERTMKMVRLLLAKHGCKLAWAVAAGMLVTAVLNSDEPGYAESMVELRRATFINCTTWGQRTVPQWR